MVDNNELKEYAMKCYQGIIGYSLEKAAKLFPKEFPKVLMYYNQYAYNDTMKLAESMRSVVFFNNGIQLMQTITGLMEQDAAHAEKILAYNEQLEQLEQETDSTSIEKVLRDTREFYRVTMRRYLEDSLALLGGIKKFANQYGFTSILKDVRNLTDDYTKQLIDINNFIIATRRVKDNV